MVVVRKVTVIVPTYRSGPGLDGLVASLDAQTLPADEFETVFVDDGSPDDTPDRLLAIAAARPNVRVERIEPSGWPSRPRNVGVELAEGEYVLFADHDDALFPDGLRAAHAFATEHALDALNPKEVRTNRATWGLATYGADAVHERDGFPADVLSPMTPHKLFRTAFLREHGIRFPERAHHLWEDNLFAVDVLRHARRVGVLGSVPVYHWVRRGGATGSTDFSDDSAEYWHYVRVVLEHVRTRLDAPELAGLRDALLADKVRVRALSWLGEQLVERPRSRGDAVVRAVRDVVGTFLPERLDPLLDVRSRRTARLVRAGAGAALRDLARHDAGWDAVATCVSSRWTDGGLVLRGTSAWHGPGFPGPRFRVTDGVPRRALPRAVEQALRGRDDETATALDGARVRLVVQHRASRVAWEVPTATVPRLVDEGGDDASLALDWSTAADVRTLAGGRPLEPGLWDVHAETTFEGASWTRPVGAALRLSPALLDGTCVVPVVNTRGRLTVDVGQTARTVVGQATPRWWDARLAGPTRLVVPLDGVEVAGRTRSPASARLLPPPEDDPRVGGIGGAALRAAQSRLRRRSPDEVEVGAALVGDEDGARLEIDLPVFVGMRPLRLRFGTHDLDPGVSVVRWGPGARVVRGRR